MTQWEYRQVLGSIPDFETDLNALGEDGWELTFVSAVPATSPLQFVAIMKRARGSVSQSHPPIFTDPVRSDPNQV